MIRLFNNDEDATLGSNQVNARPPIQCKTCVNRKRNDCFRLEREREGGRTGKRKREAGEREREREREREGDRDRDRDRQTDTDREKETRSQRKMCKTHSRFTEKPKQEKTHQAQSLPQQPSVI